MKLTLTNYKIPKIFINYNSHDVENNTFLVILSYCSQKTNLRQLYIHWRAMKLHK